MVVYGDFDADGVTATALLVETLESFGAQVARYIPHRVDEGYGLHTDALDKVAAWGARLVVTVDCGIRSLHEVKYGNSLGLDMIVTDHHSIGPEMPPALAVINPKQAGDRYGCKWLSGVGIAFKLAQALILAERRAPQTKNKNIVEESRLLDLVALGTVADVVPLLGENRALVQRGLVELNQPRRAGVQALLIEAGVQPGRVDAYSIGFMLGPRLNAAGRLDTAKLSYRLLTARDAETATPIAAQLGQLNRQRQSYTRQFVQQAQQLIALRGERQLYVAAHPDFVPGVVGLVAARLAEELNRPVLVGHQGAEITVGSARSIPGFDITGALDECRELLLRYGGHDAAAGFTVANEMLPELEARLERIAERELDGKDLQPALPIDAVVHVNDLDHATQQLLAQLEPCGQGNPQPVLASLGLEVVRCSPTKGDGKHLRLTVRDPFDTGPRRSLTWDAIAFGQGSSYADLPLQGPLVDLAYCLEVNEYNGDRRLQLNVKDIRPSTPA